MQLQRNYTLPNCTLTLEGMSDPSQGMTPGAPMTILVNAVCKFLGENEPLSGGLDFFNSLVTTTSSYAQEQLSGVRSQLSQQGLVQMRRLDSGLHEVAVYGAEQTSAEPAQVRELSTVQLFDMVEAIDQFLADGTALPGMELAIAPLAKRDVPSQEPLAQRAAAPALGVAGLAIAAAALFALPSPKIAPPVEGETAQIEAVSEDDGENTAAAGSGDDQVDLDPPETLIVDEMVLGAIGADIENRLNSAWTDPLGLESDLSYRISASADGTIVGYEGLDDNATANVSQTPLLEELYIPAEGGSIEDEPLAQFKVTFTTDDKLEVSPFTLKDFPNAKTEVDEATLTVGDASETEEDLASKEDGDETDAETQPNEASSNATASLLDAESLGREEAEGLTGQVYDNIDQAWTERPSFDGALEYRVQVSPDGDVVGFEALTDDSSDFLGDIPLSALKQSAKPDQVADFKVVFKSSGVLEVSPWDEL